MVEDGEVVLEAGDSIEPESAGQKTPKQGTIRHVLLDVSYDVSLFLLR